MKAGEVTRPSLIVQLRLWRLSVIRLSSDVSDNRHKADMNTENVDTVPRHDAIE